MIRRNAALQYSAIAAAMLVAASLLLTAHTAHARPVMDAAHQSCTSNADCTLISLTCGDPCASVPVSVSGKAALAHTLRTQCGGTLPEETDMICHMHPPMQSVCINSRCTIDYAFENHGESADYQTSQAPSNLMQTQP